MCGVCVVCVWCVCGVCVCGVCVCVCVCVWKRKIGLCLQGLPNILLECTLHGEGDRPEPGG